MEPDGVSEGGDRAVEWSLKLGRRSATTLSLRWITLWLLTRCSISHTLQSFGSDHGLRIQYPQLAGRHMRRTCIHSALCQALRLVLSQTGVRSGCMDRTCSAACTLLLWWSSQRFLQQGFKATCATTRARIKRSVGYSCTYKTVSVYSRTYKRSCLLAHVGVFMATGKSTFVVYLTGSNRSSICRMEF